MKKEVEMLDEEIQCIRSNLGVGKLIVEIGAYAGKTTEVLANSALNFVIAIDPYRKGYSFKDPASSDNLGVVCEEWLRKMRDYKNVILLQTTSQDVLSMWKKDIDTLVIDGNHEFEGIDIDKGWIIHVKDGGLMILHDYCDNWPAVQNFVDTYMKPNFEEIDHVGSLIIFRKVKKE